MHVGVIEDDPAFLPEAVEDVLFLDRKHIFKGFEILLEDNHISESEFSEYLFNKELSVNHDGFVAGGTFEFLNPKPQLHLPDVVVDILCHTLLELFSLGAQAIAVTPRE
jgi:hypothetical protein